MMRLRLVLVLAVFISALMAGPVNSAEADIAQFLDGATTIYGLSQDGISEANTLLGGMNGWQILGVKMAVTQAFKFAPNEYCVSGLVFLTYAGYGAFLWNVTVLANISGLYAIPVGIALMIWRHDAWSRDAVSTCEDPWGHFGSFTVEESTLPEFFGDQR